VTGFRALWSAAGLNALVTGGLHWQEDGVPPTTVPPYAVLRVKMPADRIETASVVYVETFVVMLEVYTPASRTSIVRALAKLDRSQTGWPAPSGKCLLVKPGEYEEQPDGERHHAADEWVLRSAWAVQVQQVRG
jgi:hypothetical protein